MAVDQGNLPDTDLADRWATIRAGLRRDIGAKLFDQWVRALTLGDLCRNTGTLDLLAPSDFTANFVRSNFADRLRLAWRAHDSVVRDIRIVRAPDGPRLFAITEHASKAVRDDAVVAAQPIAASFDGFQPRHSFDDFVIGDSNQLAHNAARQLASPDKPLFSPLFIHSGTGQGKTHLLHAVAAEFARNHPGEPVLYMSAERFMMDFVSAIRAQDTMAFKARLRAARLLLIDDIQFIAGKGPTQEEFLHTINELIDRGSRIVIAADRAPHALTDIDPRILSRMAGGLVADIQPADLPLRLAILERKRAGVSQAEISDEVIDFLARAVRTNIRELEGAFNKLVAYAQLTGKAITLDYAQTMLADAVRASARRLTIDEIQKACAAHFRIDPSEMRSHRRARAVARPRQVAMYLAKKLTPRSLPEIGRIFGGRDHSTVIHAVRTIEAMRQSNADLDADIRALQRQLER